MSTTRYIIVCEGKSERNYIQNLQSFLEQQDSESFTPRLQFNTSNYAIAHNGQYKTLENTYKQTKKINKNRSILIWADFDLYHRDDKKCAQQYREKPKGIPDFHFSYHNFEDFLALHLEGDRFNAWLERGSSGRSHFKTPLHSSEYKPDFETIFPKYIKGKLPDDDFINWNSLKNLKNNLKHQPNHLHPHPLPNQQSFAEFLVCEITSAYPDMLV